LHSDSCPSVTSKGVNGEKANGEWVSFDSKQEANDFLEKKFPDKTLFAHYCIEEHE
jgi:hypothetical protein